MPESKRNSRRRKAAVSTGSDEGFASWADAIAQLMQETPDSVTGLIDTLLQAEDECEAPQGKGKGARKKAKRKRLSDEELLAHAGLLKTALEELRYDAESKRKDAIAEIERLRQYLLEAGRRPGIDPNMFLLVLNQFAAAKVDAGSELRELTEQILKDLDGSFRGGEDGSMQEMANDLKKLATAVNGNPFAIHTEISGLTQALPPDVRAMFVTTALADKDEPALRDAALGWLVDEASEVRQAVARLLENHAGSNSGATLRRMIALRNWVPEADRPALDRAIKASQKKIACASWPPAKVLEAYITGYDGSGAQSVIMTVAQGRKRALVSVLFKQDFGVRDAWVDHGSTPAELSLTLEGLAMQMDLLPVQVEYVAAAIRHYLGVNAQTGVLPPFGLLDAAETAGLIGVNPQFLPIDALVSSLCAEIAPKRATPQAIAKALTASASWAENLGTVSSWFEEGEEIDAVLARGRLPRAKRKAALLAVPMQKRRRWWATLIAWTGYTLKHTPDASGWEDYVLVARELLGSRPLDEFGIMNEIAEATCANSSGRRL